MFPNCLLTIRQFHKRLAEAKELRHRWNDEQAWHLYSCGVSQCPVELQAAVLGEQPVFGLFDVSELSFEIHPVSQTTFAG